MSLVPEYFVCVPVQQARLAQSVERKALNLVVVGSSPTGGAFVQLRQGANSQRPESNQRPCDRRHLQSHALPIELR